MSRIALTPNASGTGTLTIAAPNTNTDRTLTLPDVTTTLVGTDATQTLTNKTFSGGTVTGATISSSTIQGGALTLGTAVASTSGTAIDFTGIPSWVKRVTVMLSGVSTNGASNYRLQLGDSGGVEVTGYSGSSSLATTSGNGYANGINFSSGFDFQGGAASIVFHGAITLTLSGSNLWACSGNLGRSDAAVTYFIGGSKTLSDVLDRVRITTVNGTDVFDAGSINIMWEG